MVRRKINDEEIGLIKAMLNRGMQNKNIQFYFNRPDRSVNSGRISEIRDGRYGPEIDCASDGEVDEFTLRFDQSNSNSIRIRSTPSEMKHSDPLSKDKLWSFFSKGSDDVWHCQVGESDQLEFKENFNLRYFGKSLKTIAGLANHRGGYIFFGVGDKQNNFAVRGLDNDRFTKTDQSNFSQTIRSAIEPTPIFHNTTLDIDGRIIGIIYVEEHRSKPVIAKKTEGDFHEGVIYYRYSGETRAICYSDLRSILDDRDRQNLKILMPMVHQLIELGPKNAMVANLLDGRLEGGQRSILIDTKSLDQIKLIREGEFDEVAGAPTLRLIGEARTVNEEAVFPVKTITEEVTLDSILRNFLELNPIERPLVFFNQASREQGWILPIFYYLYLAGKTRREAIESLNSNRSAKRKTRAELVKLLEHKRTIYSKVGGNRLATLEKIRHSPDIAITELDQVNNIVSAMEGIVSEDKSKFTFFHDILSKCLRLWETKNGDPRLLLGIRRAAARLDEVEYGPLVRDE